MAGGFRIIRDTFTPMLVAADPKRDVHNQLLDYAQAILDYAKQNAPWADRTGNARAGLDVDVFEDGDEVILELFHTVDYGLWLEVKNSGEFAIIMPTLEVFSGTVFRDIGVTDISEVINE